MVLMIYTLICFGGVLNDLGNRIHNCVDKDKAGETRYGPCFNFEWKTALGYKGQIPHVDLGDGDGIYNLPNNNDKAMFAGAIMYSLFSSILTVVMFSKMSPPSDSGYSTMA